MSTNQPWSPRETKQILSELASSGLSVAEFARQHRIPAHRLYWARRRSRMLADDCAEPAPTPTFDEVAVVDSPTSSSAPVELHLPSGISVRVTRDFDEVALRRLLGVLSPC